MTAVGLSKQSVSKIVTTSPQSGHEPTINTTPPTEEIVKLQEENNKTKIELASLRVSKNNMNPPSQTATNSSVAWPLRGIGSGR
ncbi:MAG: hypothetical protein JMJ93_07245 [Synergistaceae bacterium]|nr:hypothetical protein [Synergistaceae bacterium]